jgi:hypothetical protein
MEDYLDEKALARLPGRKYAQSETPGKKETPREHLRRLEKRQRMWMAQGAK